VDGEAVGTSDPVQIFFGHESDSIQAFDDIHKDDLVLPCKREISIGTDKNEVKTIQTAGGINSQTVDISIRIAKDVNFHPIIVQ